MVDDGSGRYGPGGEEPAAATAARHANAFVDELARCGVRHVCSSPGSTSAPLAWAFADHADIRQHVVTDERSGAFLALGIAKASGRPAVVLSTSGTGPANFLPAVIEAQRSHTALLVVTADRAPDLRGIGEVGTDQVKMFGDAVNAFVELAVPWPTPRSLAYWRNVACLAVAEATGRPPGPVHVNVSFRDPAMCSAATQRSAKAGTGGRADGRPWTDISRGELRPSDEDVARLAAFVLDHQRGFVVAAGARAQDAGPIHELAARVGWPVIGEPGSGIRHGPNVLATIEALLRAGATPDSGPDAVLRFGGPPLTAGLAELLGKGREVVVDADLSWPDPSRRVEWMLRADGGAVCEAVNRVLPPATSSPWADRWLDAEARMRAALVGALEDEPGLTEPLVVREVAAAVPPGGALVVGPSMPLRDLDWFMAPRDDIRVLANRGANGIDGFASTALGIALAGDAPVVAVAGDLTVLHDQNGLLAARALGGSLVLVVVNNDGGGIFAFSPAADGSEEFDAVFAAGTRADFAGLAQTIGAEYERPESVAELRRALARRPPVGVRLVEVRTDRAENVAVHARIWQRAAARFAADRADAQAGAPV